jgi:glycosyltransferase involved in cell wall biosynthesis
MKKKVLILTLNDYIIYQPSILNLYDFLKPHFDVTVVSFSPQAITKQKDETRNIIYLQPGTVTKYFLGKLDFALSLLFKMVSKIVPGAGHQHIYYTKYLPWLLKTGIKKNKLTGDIIIATDFPALKVAQEIYGAVHFISLEIENNTSPVFKQINRQLVKSVFIQTKERYDYLFPDQTLPVFYVQNAPVFDEASITGYNRKDFIWAGAIDRRLAVYDCINFFDRYKEFKLVLKGGIQPKEYEKITERYSHLIQSGNIRFDKEYLPASSFLDFLSHFRIGFCFYSWEIIKASFNYATAPSGKLFMTLAAGVPVIACNIPAFKFLEEYKAGVLVNDYEPETILAAVKKIEADYEQYHSACYAAAKYFSFDKRVASYVDFLIEQAKV